MNKNIKYYALKRFDFNVVWICGGFMSYQQAPERVTVTLPDESKDMFAWIKAFEPQFEGRDAAVAAFLIKLGAEAFYQKGLERIEPLDADVTAALEKASMAGLSEAVSDTTPVGAKVASGR